jgi:hypothetical protein
VIPSPTVDLQTLTIQPLQPLLANSNPTFRATIRNNGSAASGNFNIRWIADEKVFDGGHNSIPAGTVDTHDYIWSNITAGQHTLTFIANFDHTIAETTTRNNQATLTFTVRSDVPFYTQYAGQRTQNMDCGPTSVAMVLSFYRKGPGGSGAGISQIRIQTGNSSGDTSFGDLERALRSYGSSYSEVPNNISLDAQMSQMRNAVLGGHPVIALIHGATLGRRAAYGDHWLVLRGFSSDGNTVYLQDPDTQSPRWSGWLPGGQITLSYSTFRLAVYQAQFGPSGIIVWS